MNYNIKVEENLQKLGIKIIKNEESEIVTHCIFSTCDKDSRVNEGHLYFNKNDGTYYCHKCNVKGNQVTLYKHFGQTYQQKDSQEKSGVKFTQKLVDKAHACLPDNIRKYLNGRGVSDEVINKYKLGWFNYVISWICIPVRLQDQIEYSHFILRKDPFSKDDSFSKNLSFPKGKSQTCLFGELANENEDLIITEGIMDCLSLLSLGVKAIFSTGGAMTFKQEWITSELLKAKRIFVAYDNDEAGRNGSEKVLKMLKEAGYKNLFLVNLPIEVGNKGDVNDYLVKLKLPVEDLFEKYAEPYPKLIDYSGFEELSMDDVENILSLTIKKDRVNKLLMFFCQLSAYTSDNQFNIVNLGPSSTGKSHNAIECSKLFPAEDIVSLGSCSPTAFFHDSGKYDKETNTTTVDLENKILIFKENQHYKLLEMLRSFLSHDEKVTIVKITDKNQKGGNKTKNIKLIGYSAVVFCTAFSKADEQEKTRCIILSPEITDEKIKDGIGRIIDKEGRSNKYDEEIEGNNKRNDLKLRIRAIRDLKIKNIYLTEEDAKYLESEFYKTLNHLQPRHQRDIKRVISLVKSIALLNFGHRCLIDGNITVARKDIDYALELYSHISVTQNLGISPYHHTLYEEVVKPCYMEKLSLNFGHEIEGITYQEILNYNYKHKKLKLGYNDLRMQVIPELETCGLVEKNYSNENQRKVMIHVIEKPIDELKDQAISETMSREVFVDF